MRPRVWTNLRYPVSRRAPKTLLDVDPGKKTRRSSRRAVCSRKADRTNGTFRSRHPFQRLALIRRVRRRRGQRQHRLAVLQTLGPHDVRLVVDVLHDDGERAIVLPRHRPVTQEVHAEASMVAPSGRFTSSAALRSESASMPPYFLMALGRTSSVKAQALLARLAQKQRDVGVVAGVEQDVGAGALELDHEGREVGRGGRVAFFQHDVEAGLLRPLLVALRDVDAVRAVLVDDGDLE